MSISEAEKAIVFAACAELEGTLAHISDKHKLKVVPAFLWDDMMNTITVLTARCSLLESENEAVRLSV